MTKIKFTPISFVLIPVLSAAILSGCVREKIDVNQGAQDDFVQTDGPGGEEGVVNFRFSTASLVTATRSMAPADETAVTTVDLLEFSGTDNTLLYHYTPKGSGNSWSAKLTSTGGVQNRYLFIINASAEVAKILESAASPLTASEFEQQLQFATDAAWDSSAPRYLPMYAEKTVAYTSGSGNNTWNLKLLRSVARIDVGLNFTTAASSNPSAESNIADGIADFSLTKVSVYTIPQSSLVSPGADIYNKWAGGSQPEETKLATGGQTTTGFASGIEYLAEAESSGKWFFRQIYVGEASNHTGSAPKTNENLACLVVAGQYKGTEGYYRIDLATTSQDGVVTYFDVVRNFRYLVNIKSVNGPGYADAQTAFNSAPKNIEYDITVIEEGDMNDITFDGRYQLAVDRSTLDFFRSPSTSVVSVYADHPSGWTVERAPVSEGGPFDWIELPSGQTGTSAVTEQLAITVKKFEDYRTEEDKRQGWFYIKSGTLSKKINIVQSAGILLNIEVTPTSLVFRKTAGSPKTITVTVDPVFKDRIQFTAQDDVAPVGNNGTFTSWTKYMEETGNAVEDPVTGTVTKTFAFQPADRTGNNLQGVLAGLVTIYIQDPDDPSGRIEARTLTVEQLATDIALEVLNLKDIAAAGETFGISVRSDVSWWLDRIALEGGTGTTDQAVASNPGSSTSAHPVGTVTLNVEFKPNNSWKDRIFLFYASSSNPEFQSDVPFRMTQKAPAPTLTVDSQTIDFGSDKTATNKTLKITTNAKVVASMTDTEQNWNYVNNSMSPTRTELKTPSGQETFNTTYVFREGSGYVTFHPRNYPDGDLSSQTYKPGAAGTKHDVDITFSTSVGQQGVAEATKTVTVSRTDPALFYGPELPTEAMPASGGSLTVKGKTNAAWIAESGSAKSAVKPAQAYAASEVQLQIPALTPAQYGSQPGETVDVPVKVRYGLPGNVSAASGGTAIDANAKQRKYYVTAPTITWNKNASNTNGKGGAFSGGQGGSVTIKFPESVDVPQNKIKTRITLLNNQSTQLASQEIDVTKAATLNFSSWDQWVQNARTLCVEWENPKTGSWERMTGNTANQFGRALPWFRWLIDGKINADGSNAKFSLSTYSNGFGDDSDAYISWVGSEANFYFELYGYYATESGVVSRASKTLLRSGQLTNTSISQGSVSIPVGYSLYNRKLELEVYLRKSPNYQSKNYSSYVTNFGSDRYQPATGGFIVEGGGEGGRTFLVAPTAIDITNKGLAWHSAVGTTPSSIWWGIENGANKFGSVPVNSPEQDVCALTYTQNNTNNNVKGLSWRLPTEAEMVKIIEKEQAAYPSHHGGNQPIYLTNNSYICALDNQAINQVAYLTRSYYTFKNADYVGGVNTWDNLVICPSFIIHGSPRAFTGSYPYSQDVHVVQRSADVVDPAKKNVPIAWFRPKVYIRCIAYLTD